jgi:signal transduction histidine kinase
MFIASFKTPILFLFVHTFPEKHIKLNKTHLATVLVIMLSSACLSLTPLVFKSLDYKNSAPVPVPGIGISIFMLNFIGFLVLSIIILIRKYRGFQKEGKQQTKYLLWGIICSFSLFAIVNLIFVVLFKISTFIFLAPLFLTFLIVPIAYATVKHGLFNVKVALTSVLVTVLWIILLARLVVIKTPIELIVDAIIFIIAVIFGVFLVRNVKKEISQREKIEGLAKSLTDANNKLKELNEIKSEFISLATHHIASPLTATKGYVSILQEAHSEQTLGKNKEILNILERLTNNTVNIVKDFLDVNKIDEGEIRYEFTDFYFRELLESIVIEYEPIIARRKLRFTYTFDIGKNLLIHADREKIKLALTNIFDNSVKYTSEGYIKFNAFIKENECIIKLEDNGVRNLPTISPRLHRKFTQLGNIEEANIIGNGLGVYAAKLLIEGNGGHLSVESNNGITEFNIAMSILI